MTSARAQRGAVAGEYVMTEEDFTYIADVLRKSTGIDLGAGKATLAYSRLAKRLRRLGLESFSAYCDLIGSPQGAEELQAMVAALTTNVTRFFREPHHFETLGAEFDQRLSAVARSGQGVRLWSAACSSGQEPYSMAMTVLDRLSEAASLDVRILATDIDPNMLAHGRHGVYEADVAQAIPPALRTRFAASSDRSRFEVGQAMRSLVVFNTLNLNGAWPMKRRFDVIFCRNVAIYFDEATQERLWARLCDALAPGGLLCIGHSERISGPAERRFDLCGLTTYRRSAP
ncbi:MAG: chemotaxis protein [Alphaproteobacteria bacterium]|nr:chemotaxis protein [Alphaproteobacteria bacterium]